MLDIRESQRQHERKRMTIGWGVCGGMAVIAVCVVLLVNGANRVPAAPVERPGRPDATNQPKIDAAIATINATRGLVAQLDSIDSQVRTQPGADTLRKLFATIHDGELASLAKEAGGQYKARYDSLVTTVNRDYVAALRAAANSAVSATTSEALAPFAELEDTLRAVIEDETTANDADTQSLYRPMLKQVFVEGNWLATKRFDDAYQRKVAWQDLLGDVTGWRVIASPSFTHELGDALALTNTAIPDAAPGGLRYVPDKGWRDCVIDVELKLHSGSLVVHARAGDPFDGKLAPSQTLGLANHPDILLDSDKTHALTISVIGNRLGVLLDGTTLRGIEQIGIDASRVGGLAIVARPGTRATIRRLRVRNLR